MSTKLQLGIIKGKVWKRGEQNITILAYGESQSQVRSSGVKRSLVRFQPTQCTLAQRLRRTTIRELKMPFQIT